MQRILLENLEHDSSDGENPILYHVLRMQKRNSVRVIPHVQDENTASICNTTQTEIRIHCT